jgi:hypothetical protein
VHPTTLIEREHLSRVRANQLIDSHILIANKRSYFNLRNYFRLFKVSENYIGHATTNLIFPARVWRSILVWLHSLLSVTSTRQCTDAGFIVRGEISDPRSLGLTRLVSPQWHCTSLSVSHVTATSGQKGMASLLGRIHPILTVTPSTQQKKIKQVMTKTRRVQEE